jgi:hypothetical protein
MAGEAQRFWWTFCAFVVADIALIAFVLWVLK